MCTHFLLTYGGRDKCHYFYFGNITLKMIITVQNFWTPLMAASSKGHIECVEMLVKAETATIDRQNKVLFPCIYHNVLFSIL